MSKRKYETDDGPSKKIKTVESTLQPRWQDYELLADIHNIDYERSKVIVKLFQDGNTIPFIARYRKQQTENMTPDRLRDIKRSYENIFELKKRMSKVLDNLQKLNKLDTKLKENICNVRSLEVLEHIFAPYKPTKAHTLADKARQLGLEQPALDILHSKPVNLPSFINSNKDGLRDIEEVSKSIQHIIAHKISGDIEVLTFIKLNLKKLNILMKTVKKEAKDYKNETLDEDKFRIYFNYEVPIKYIKPHQVLAINRGEKLKILNVKIVIPEYFVNKFKEFCWKQFKIANLNFQFKTLMDHSILDCYTRLLRPLINREIRNDLNANAENASYTVFSTNIKHLFLATPIKGEIILAIDPGFKHGCKIAVVSETGNFLESHTIYPHSNNTKNIESSAKTLTTVIRKFSCSLVAIGDGTACRETETWLSNLIENGAFAPLKVQYTIVSECGASVYSCSKEAKQEFSNLDINIISAVSIARRLQDPMAELVKIEPYHLGVGMYQHDLNKKKLTATLEETVEECVSFIGVDVNTTSHSLLRKVAGLGDVRAKNILKYREENGPFTNRKELLQVKGIGASVYKQCAGFIRVCPYIVKDADSLDNDSAINPLDATWIHPESYKLASNVAKKFKLNLKNLGKKDFIETVHKNTRNMDLSYLTKELKCDEANLKLILDVFGRSLDHDIRSEKPIQPMFRSGIQKITELRNGDVLSGRVNNCTHFGCFVDVGVGVNGLIHSSKLGTFILNVGDRVEVKVESIDILKKRLSLLIVRLL